MTSLLSALRNEMIPGNAPGSQAECYALQTILELRDHRIAELERALAVRNEELSVAREALESSRRALMLKQSENDFLDSQVRRLNGGKPLVSPISGKVFT